MTKGTLRRHNRLDSRTLVELMWKDPDGNDKFTKAYTLDVSETGLRVEVPEPIPERSYVIFRAEGLELHGTASVRTCHRKGVKNVVGLEFSTGMRWKPKPDMADNVKELARAVEADAQAPQDAKTNEPVPR